MSKAPLTNPSSLTDEEAGKEMKKMIAFIMQEASEKCREINIRAEEEFNLEKAKIVRNETLSLDLQYGRKAKQAEIKRKISQSNQINKARLKVLQAQDEVLGEIAEQTKHHLIDITKDGAVYSNLMSRLLLQCMFRLMEERLVITCRKDDVLLVEGIVPQTLEQYQAATGGILINIQIDQNNYLDDDCAGGLIVASGNGRIRCDNTLETRLNQAFEAMLPVIRVTLFGHSEHRRFFD